MNNFILKHNLQWIVEIIGGILALALITVSCFGFAYILQNN